MLSEQAVSTRLEDRAAQRLSPKNELVPSDYRAGQGPGPGVKSKNPETVPENSEEVVVPVVFTTTTKSDCAGTMKEYDAFGTVVPSPTTPVSPR